MRFGICDLRRIEEKTPKEYIDAFYTNNLRDEVIIIGHSSDGIQLYGLYSNDVIPKKNEYFIWVYACNCGNNLCKDLSKKGYLIVGFIRKILAFRDIPPPEIKYIEKHIATLRGLAVDSVENEFKDKMYSYANNSIKAGDFLLAIIINYNRLNLRAF